MNPHIPILLLLLLSQPTYADLIILQDNGITHETAPLSGFSTEGDDMAGMTVEVTFSDLSRELRVWAATSPGSGGAFGTGWQITQGAGSTWSNPFAFTNTGALSVTKFTLHGAPANTVFDRSFAGAGTPTSANGRDIFEFGSSITLSQDVTATYFDQVQLPGETPVGDLFAGLEVRFADGLSNGQAFRFITDTDTGGSNLIVPEPSGVTAVCLSLGAILHRRRNRVCSTRAARKA